MGIGRAIWSVVGVASAAALAGAVFASTHDARPRKPDAVDSIISESWKNGWAAGAAGIAQDATQRDCTGYGDRPPDRVAVTIMEREWRSIVLPSDGSVLGDWRRGEALARAVSSASRSDGGATPSSASARERKDAARCDSCHQLDTRDGLRRQAPSLFGYGRSGGPSRTARLVYEQIYNSNAVVACSAMPRFGTHKLLSPEEIRDIVAFLLAPESPVNTNAAAPGE